MCVCVSVCVLRACVFACEGNVDRLEEGGAERRG